MDLGRVPDGVRSALRTADQVPAGAGGSKWGRVPLWATSDTDISPMGRRQDFKGKKTKQNNRNSVLKSEISDRKSHGELRTLPPHQAAVLVNSRRPSDVSGVLKAKGLSCGWRFESPADQAGHSMCAMCVSGWE